MLCDAIRPGQQLLHEPARTQVHPVDVLQLVQLPIELMEAGEVARVTFDIGADGRQAHGQPDRRIAQRIDEAACNRRIVPVQVVGPVRLDHQEGGVRALEEFAEFS